MSAGRSGKGSIPTWGPITQVGRIVVTPDTSFLHSRRKANTGRFIEMLGLQTEGQGCLWWFCARPFDPRLTMLDRWCHA